MQLEGDIAEITMRQRHFVDDQLSIFFRVSGQQSNSGTDQ